MKAPREEIVRFWALQRLLDLYCFGRCEYRGYCLVWRDNGASFRIDLADLCPYKAARKAMAFLRQMLMDRPVSYYSPEGEEYEEVMAEVEERLKGDVAAILSTS